LHRSLEELLPKDDDCCHCTCLFPCVMRRVRACVD